MNMEQQNRWMLPAGIIELLPPQAAQVERLRRRLLDLYNTWGYELIIPPIVEYLESLLVGTGGDLDLDTFKLTDQLTGRLMGVRADITPQAAKMDAHHLKRDVPVRLCYLGQVLRTKPDGFFGFRSPLQLGAELFGHSGPESDAEVLKLMVETLKVSSVNNIHLDIGHIGIFKGLTDQAGLDDAQVAILFDALQRKAVPEIHEYLAGLGLPDNIQNMFASLARLNGGREILQKADEVLAGATDEVKEALLHLRKVADLFEQSENTIPVHFDLAELRGFGYQTGIVFAAFVAGHGEEIARGGRYDEVGAAFGNARPATGFSTDLLTLMHLGEEQATDFQGILSPVSDDPGLQAIISRLRGEGQRVVQLLPGQKEDAAQMQCAKKLVPEGDSWVVKDID